MEERESAANALKEAGLKEEAEPVMTGVDKKRLIDDVRQALYASKICSYAQGMNLLRAFHTYERVDRPGALTKLARKSDAGVGAFN